MKDDKCKGGNMIGDQKYCKVNDYNDAAPETSSWCIPIPDFPASMAEEHVDWFLKIVRPMLISYFEHGYKHGEESKDG
jgi:hypothetical protein